MFENDPGAVFLLAQEEEFHGRPLDALVAQHVDQMDQQRSGEEPQKRIKRMNQRKHFYDLFLCCIPMRLLKNAASAASSGWLVRKRV